MFASERNGIAALDHNNKTPIEMDNLKSKTDSSISASPDGKTSDVVIGRFRKISSAKSMANTNGGPKYPDVPPVENEDPEAGLVLKPVGNGSVDDRDKFAEVSENTTLTNSNKSKITKSSFRNTEKPSRFKNMPSTTRFQVKLITISYT